MFFANTCSEHFFAIFSPLFQNLTEKVNQYSDTTYSVVKGLGVDTANKKLGLIIEGEGGADTLFPFSGFDVNGILEIGTLCCTGNGGTQAKSIIYRNADGTYSRQTWASNTTSERNTLNGVFGSITGGYGSWSCDALRHCKGYVMNVAGYTSSEIVNTWTPFEADPNGATTHDKCITPFLTEVSAHLYGFIYIVTEDLSE